jgi:hypothetical protein
MKKLLIVGVIFIFIGVGLLSGCEDKSSTNGYSGDFAKVHEASDNRIKTELLNHGYDYHDIEAMTFDDRDVLIVDGNHWSVTGEFTIAGVTHSYTSEVSMVDDQYNAATTISEL